MIKHVVLIKIKPDIEEAKIDEITDMMKKLPSLIPEIKEYIFGKDIIKSERSFDFGLIASFDSRDDLEVYMKHKYHLPIVEKVKAISEKNYIIDFDDSEFEEKNEDIIIYTDGGAENNPGPGGYAAVIIKHGQKYEISGGFKFTTNNRMELTACIESLKSLEKKASVILFCDSKYVVDGITKGWAKKWRKNSWMRNKTEPALNPDLWEKLLNLCEKHDVQFKWVKGHAGVKENERCDFLVQQAMRGRNLQTDSEYEKPKI